MPHWIRSASAAMGLAALLALGIGAWPEGGSSPAWAQGEVELEIEDVMERLDRDFSFGDKDEIKRETLKETNAANREDVQIQQNVVLQQKQQQQQAAQGGAPVVIVPVLFDLEERQGGASIDAINFSFSTGQSFPGLDNGNIFPQINLPTGSNQILFVQCISSIKKGVQNPACEFQATIISANGKFQATGTPFLGTTPTPIPVPVGTTGSFPFT
ncbi:MAG: hypothetical protein ACE5ER_05160, partial [Nitrospinaceae bacterium]